MKHRKAWVDLADAALLGFLLVYLSIRVIRLRRRLKCAVRIR